MSHQVTLNWTPGANDVSFNVYRGTVKGGPYTKLTATPVSAQTFQDTTVDVGTFFYVVTGLDSAGVESAFSNEASATITGVGAPTNLFVSNSN